MVIHSGGYTLEIWKKTCDIQNNAGLQTLYASINYDNFTQVKIIAFV